MNPIAQDAVLFFFSSDAGIHDRVVIMELLKEVAQSHSLDTTHKDFKGNLNTYYLKWWKKSAGCII